MMSNPRGSFGCSAFVLAAVLLSGAAVACWFVPGRQSSLRVTAIDVAAWRGSLLERANTMDDVEARALAGDSDASFRARATGGRSRLVTGAEWERIFANLAKATGQWQDSLPPERRNRISTEDESHVTAVFFPPAEEPFQTLELPPGQTVFLELDPAGKLLLEAVHVPAGVSEGDVTTSRFFKSRWTLPSSIAWPLRRTALKLAGLALVMLLAGFIFRMASSGSAQASPITAAGVVPDNARRRSGWRSIFVAFAFFGLCFVPALTGMNMMNGGFALIFVAGGGALSAFIVSLVFFASAKRLDRLLNGEALFAHWVFPPDQWQRFAEAEYGMEASDKRTLFRFVAGIILVITAGFVVVVRDRGALWVAVVMGVLVIVLWLVATLGPGVQRARHLEAAPEAWIGPAGILIGGTFHDFTMSGGRIEQAGLRDSEGALILEVRYSYLSRAGRSTVAARVPVPDNDAREGQRIGEMIVGEADRFGLPADEDDVS